MRRVIFAAWCAAALLVVPGSASAATNGQLVVVTRYPSALVTLNADGSGVRTLWSAGSDLTPSSPVWSPDGNRIAFVFDGRVKTIVLATGVVSDLAAGSDPGWLPDGEVAFRRGQDLLAVPAGGGAERTLNHLPDADTTAIAWSPDGWIARSMLGELRVDAFDGAGEEGIAGGANFLAEWSPDGKLLAYPFSLGNTIRIRLVALDGDGANVTTGPPDTWDLAPAWSPDGKQILYRRTNQVPAEELRIVDLDSGQDRTIASSFGSWDGADWQPCVTGLTTSCVSVTPSRAFACTAAPLSVRSGLPGSVRFSCSNGSPETFEVLTPPSHGTTSYNGVRNVTYRSAADYTGPDSLTVRVSDFAKSTTVTVNVNVTPTFAALAAPKLNVTGRPRLDRRGRVTLRATCTKACSLALRVIIRLNTQRVLKGRMVKATGTTFKLRLQRAKLPRHRRIVAARVAGTITGTTPVPGIPQKRNFTLSLIP